MCLMLARSIRSLGQELSLSVLPLSHVFERTGMYVYILYGMRCFLLRVDREGAGQSYGSTADDLYRGARIFEKVFERASMKRPIGPC